MRSTNNITVWVVDYGRKYLMLQWKDPVTGKRRSESSECTNHKKALLAAAKKEDELNSRLPRRDGAMSFEIFTEEYDEKHLTSLSDASRKRSLSVLQSFEEVMAPERLSDITGGVLSDYAAKMRVSPVKRSRPKKKPGQAAPIKLNSEANIATHMRTLRAALSWAEDNDLIAELPSFPKQARARRRKAKGRPLTMPEFVAFLRAIPKHFAKACVENPRSFIRDYRRLAIGIRRSGLRLEESLDLTWMKDGSHEDALWVDMSGKYPLLGIVAESEKGKEDRLLPIVPEFARWLLKIPESQRTGHVFKLAKHRNKDDRNMRSVSKLFSDIGKESGVVVNSRGKFASIHDMRRTFGLIWSRKCYPAELMQLMRHKSIDTTMDYYVEEEANSFAARLWAAESADRTTINTTPSADSESKKKKNP